MQYALVDSNNVVQHRIIYDGKSAYTPPVGLTVQQVNDWVQEGQSINAPVPTPQISPPPTPDLAVQVAAALINANVIPSSALTPDAVAKVNSQLTAAGKPVIAAVLTP